MLIFNLIGFLLASLVMLKCANYALAATFRIEKSMRISSFIVSFFLVGLVSAFPEGFISIVSAFKGVSTLGFGTLMGSVIADLSLVLGIVGIVAGRSKLAKGFKHEIWLLLLLVLPIVLALDGVISRVDGVILIGGCCMFFYNLLQKNNVMKKLLSSDNHGYRKHLIIFAISSALIFVSANFVVKYAQLLAIDLKVPLIVVGLVMIALATSLPEFIFAITAAKKKLADVAIGELLGVVVIDATLLIGIVALINPIMVEGIDLGKIGIFTVTALALAAYFLRKERVFTWQDGLFMVFLYFVFVITELTATV